MGRTAMIDRPKFRELHLSEIDEDGPEGYDLVQLKMDGIWGCMVIRDCKYVIYSRTGKAKQIGDLPHDRWDSTKETILLGEFMKGSHWGHKMDIDGDFYAFDCIKYNDVDIKNEPYHVRLDIMSVVVNKQFPENFVKLLPTVDSNLWTNLWYNEVIDQAYEGLVFKRSDAGYYDKHAWARLKSVVEIEYMCIGMEPADPESRYAGQVGAVIGSLSDKVCAVQCGGLTDEMRREFTDHPERYVGQVFTAKGNGWYPSGSIRHPKFKQWRDDKEFDECTYDQIPEIIREG